MKDFAASSDPAVQEQLDRLARLSLPQGRFGLETIRALLERFMDDALRAAGGRYYPWTTRSLGANAAPGEGERMLRLICAFDTDEAAVDAFIAVAARAGAVHAAATI